MKILVTGGAGFIGSHIVDMLIENGHQVVVLDNMSHGKCEYINPKAKFYEIDIRDKDILDIFGKEKPEVVFHEAAQICVSNSISDPISDAEINIMGSINLLEASVKTGVKKFIYPASAAIFGDPEYLPIDENHPLNMISGYGVSKHTVEHYLKVYNTLYGLQYVALRYANVYGPRQDSSGEGGVIAIFAEKMLKNETPVIFGDGEHTRDFVYVKDVAAANLMVMNSDINGIYNISTNTQISINELVKLYNKLLNADFKPIYKEERKGDIRHSYMSYDKINNAIGWKPQYSIEDGLRETLEFYKK